jgi:hypothetical protein
LICPELQPRQAVAEPDFQRFDYLHLDGKRLIKSWFKRAQRHRVNDYRRNFEAFIFAWISFNGWSASVTGEDVDRRWIGSLSLSVDLQQSFEFLMTSGKSSFAESARAFHDLWPVFGVRQIRRMNLQWHGIQGRKEIVNHYLSSGLTACEPRCGIRHLDEGEMIPLDWAHTLAALYRIRNNLFHGEKAPYSENDQQMVRAALLVLIAFMQEAEPIFGKDKQANMRMDRTPRDGPGLNR